MTAMDMKKIANGVYIPDDLGKLFTVDEWLQRAHPETARTVVLVTDLGMLEIAKNDLRDEFDFEGAQKAAAKYGDGFRCATRHEAIEMYAARFHGLDEAFKKIGGRPATDIYWTSDINPNPEHGFGFAFVYSGHTGNMDNSRMFYITAVRPVRSFVSAVKK